MTDQELREKVLEILPDRIIEGVLTKTTAENTRRDIVELCHQYADGKIEKAAEMISEWHGRDSGNKLLDFTAIKMVNGIRTLKSHRPKEKA